MQIEPHAPGFVQQVVENCGLVSGQKSLSVAPMIHEPEADAEELIDYLINTSRQLPIFVVTSAEGGQTDHATLDTAALSRAARDRACGRVTSRRYLATNRSVREV